MDTNTINNLRSFTLGKLLQEEPIQLKINKNNVQNLVELFNKLNHNEKLLFLINVQHGPTLEVPRVTGEEDAGSSPPPSSLRLTQTSDWLLQNFTQDSQTALPKEEVYDFYLKSIATKPISTADFGKLMRQVFPDVKARRLGQRGASKYCYANIRKRSEYDLERPKLHEIKYSLENDYITWGKSNFGLDFTTLPQLLSYLKCNNFKSVLLRKRRNSSFSGNKKTKEDLEIKKYFPEKNEEYPQLRNLLSNEFAPINKKRHFSNVEVEVKAEAFRSASVPIFDRFLSSSADSGYDSVHSNTPNVLDYNPLLSSASVNNDVLFDSVFDLISNDNQEDEDHFFEY